MFGLIAVLNSKLDVRLEPMQELGKSIDSWVTAHKGSKAYSNTSLVFYLLFSQSENT